ncbi:MAG: HAL2 family 3'(2'),5'-bisphosphate nucleotidase [Candidatus Promineifilaceae bacterium]|jgi:HAL2 family 3'(2'),5'-bisphosphate nucleotidase
MTTYETEAALALEALQKACRLTQSVRSALVTEDTFSKKDKSPVTVADYGAQAVISHMLAQTFPRDPLIAEEDAHDLKQPDQQELLAKVCEHVSLIDPSLNQDAIVAAIDRGNDEGGRGRFWTMDPIDGTKGFIRGDQYAVALALIIDGEVVLGALGCPNLPQGRVGDTDGIGVIYVARKGQGCEAFSLNGDALGPIRVSDATETSQIALCESVEAGHTAHGRSGRIASTLGIQVDPVRLDSQCKYAVVARGEAGTYMRLSGSSGYVEKIWDHAAGLCVVVEAGGRVSDTNGVALDFTRGATLTENVGVVASNGHVHDAVIDAIAQVAQTD